MATLAWALQALVREVGRRRRLWVLHRLKPDSDQAAPSRVQCARRVYRRRAKQRSAVATLFGPVEVWRRLYEALEHGVRSIHPLELHGGVEAGLATPA